MLEKRGNTTINEETHTHTITRLLEYVVASAREIDPSTEEVIY